MAVIVMIKEKAKSICLLSLFSDFSFGIKEEFQE
jgi:hypothetical protein